MPERHARWRPQGALLWLVRYGIPVGLIAFGAILPLIPGHTRLTSLVGMGLFMGAGVAVLLLNVLFRMGAQSDRDRRREEAAREYFRQHGRWPGRGTG